MTDDTLLLGPTLRFDGDPFHLPWAEAVSIDTDGAVLLRDGHIADVGRAAALTVAHPGHGSCATTRIG